MELVTAINICLRGIGRAPVATANDPDLEAATAKATIEQVSNALQSRGWYFNTEANWAIAPDSSGNVYAPNNALDIITAQCSRNSELVLRGNRIYDTLNHTYDLSDAVCNDGYIHFTFVVELPFNELPAAAANAVAFEARVMFAQDIEGDPQNWRFRKEDANNAMVILERTERRNKKSNHLNNPTIGNFIIQAGGPNGMHGELNPFLFPKSKAR